MMYKTQLGLVLFAATALANPVAEPEPIWNPFTYIFGSKPTTTITVPVTQQTHHISGFTIKPPAITGTATARRIPGPMEQVSLHTAMSGAAAQPTATGLWQHAKIGVTNLGQGIEHEAVYVGHGIEHKAADAGHGIQHGVADVGHDIQHGAAYVGHGIQHGASEVGQDIKHGAQVAEHKVESVFRRNKGPARPEHEHGPVPIINRRAQPSLTVPAPPPVPPKVTSAPAAGAKMIKRASSLTVPAPPPVPPKVTSAPAKMIKRAKSAKVSTTAAPAAAAGVVDNIERVKINKRGWFNWGGPVTATVTAAVAPAPTVRTSSTASSSRAPTVVPVVATSRAPTVVPVATTSRAPTVAPVATTSRAPTVASVASVSRAPTVASAVPTTARASSVATTAARVAVVASPTKASTATTAVANSEFDDILRVKITRRSPRENFRRQLAKKALAMPDY